MRGLQVMADVCNGCMPDASTTLVLDYVLQWANILAGDWVPSTASSCRQGPLPQAPPRIGP